MDDDYVANITLQDFLEIVKSFEEINTKRKINLDTTQSNKKLKSKDFQK